MKIFRLTTLLLVAFASREAVLGQVIRVNVAGGQITDPSGNVWEADGLHNYCAGTQYYACPMNISNTVNDDLYCSYRFFNQAPYLCQVPVPNGNYNVRLHFAETYVIRGKQIKCMCGAL
jgi:Malectin domain